MRASESFTELRPRRRLRRPGRRPLFSGPRPDKADWDDIHRVPYGTDVTISEGPAKGFVIGEAITGPKRG